MLRLWRGENTHILKYSKKTVKVWIHTYQRLYLSSLSPSGAGALWEVALGKLFLSKVVILTRALFLGRPFPFVPVISQVEKLSPPVGSDWVSTWARDTAGQLVPVPASWALFGFEALQNESDLSTSFTVCSLVPHWSYSYGCQWRDAEDGPRGLQPPLFPSCSLLPELLPWCDHQLSPTAVLPQSPGLRLSFIMSGRQQWKLQSSQLGLEKWCQCSELIGEIPQDVKRLCWQRQDPASGWILNNLTKACLLIAHKSLFIFLVVVVVVKQVS